MKIRNGLVSNSSSSSYVVVGAAASKRWKPTEEEEDAVAERHAQLFFSETLDCYIIGRELGHCSTESGELGLKLSFDELSEAREVANSALRKLGMSGLNVALHVVVEAS